MPLGIISWQNSSLSSLSKRSAPQLNLCLSLRTCKPQCPPATFHALPCVLFLLDTYRMPKFLIRWKPQNPQDRDRRGHILSVSNVMLVALHDFCCISVFLFYIDIYKKTWGLSDYSTVSVNNILSSCLRFQILRGAGILNDTHLNNDARSVTGTSLKIQQNGYPPSNWRGRQMVERARDIRGTERRRIKWEETRTVRIHGENQRRK